MTTFIPNPGMPDGLVVGFCNGRGVNVAPELRSASDISIRIPLLTAELVSRSYNRITSARACEVSFLGREPTTGQIAVVTLTTATD